MPLAGWVVKKISLIKRIAEVELLLRYTYENAAAYLFGNASQVPQNPGDPRRSDRQAIALPFLGETRRTDAGQSCLFPRRFPSAPPTNFHSFCEPFPLVCLHNNEGSSRRIFPVSRPEPHHLG
jgi:hypothetical protein